MRPTLDFANWPSLLSTLFGLILVTLVAVGIRLIVMQTLQRRRERENRQINERLRTLIAAYKTLGGSFTGELQVDPRHLRDLLQAQGDGDDAPSGAESPSSERRRRVRDAVEAALSDVILLGTEEQVRLAAEAAREMVAGRPVHTGALVVSLRAFIREALDLAPVPSDVVVPDQGPLRTAPAGGRGRNAEGGGGRGGGGGGQGGGGEGAAMGLHAGGLGRAADAVDDLR